MPERTLRLEARVVRVACSDGRTVDGGLAAPEDLDQFVSGVGLLDESVECAGLTPLSGELSPGNVARLKSVTTIARDSDDAHRREQRRDPEQHPHDAHDRQHRVSSWLSPVGSWW